MSEMESDRREGAPHPRDTQTLIGHEAQERAFLDAYASGRFPHAWILAGAEGVGKATFAYRAAAFVLTHPDPLAPAVQNAPSLDVAESSKALHLIRAESHPDLLVLKRRWHADRKRLETEIPVDHARDVVGFFGSTAGSGGWRVLIVDAGDDLNRNSANALLKLIEEPPPRCLVMIVSHVPERLIPTIRSRCRLMQFRPLNEDQVVAALEEAEADATPEAIRQAASFAEGSPGRAFRFVDDMALAIMSAVRAQLDALPVLDRLALHQMADGLAGRQNDESYALFEDVLAGWIHEQLVRAGRSGTAPARLAPLIEVWDKARASMRDAEIFNLDRRALILTLFADLSDAVRATRAA